jgi:hypothetical protein
MFCAGINTDDASKDGGAIKPSSCISDLQHAALQEAMQW